MSKEILTESDTDALGRMPNGRWFTVCEVPYMVRRARWRCDRLVSLGMLESKVCSKPVAGSTFPHTWTEYRKP